jgi:hypothetical protein
MALDNTAHKKAEEKKHTNAKKTGKSSRRIVHGPCEQ